jgi:hypothetical protein
MRTNLSRFTVSFCDFAWESLSVSGDVTSDGEDRAVSPPMFPYAWQVSRYLEGYVDRYIPPEVLRLGCRVVRTERRHTNTSLSNDGVTTTAADDDGKWMVEWVEEGDCSNVDTEKTGQTATRSERFDYLIVASGYFSRPHIPDIPGLKYLHPNQIIHSSALRDVEGFLQQLQELPGSSTNGWKKLVVVGGSLSGAEAASSLALYLSSSVHGPAAPGRVPEPEEAQPSKPGPDPMIQMLATRAASNPELKALMRAIAMGDASQDQMRAFQAHIDEINTIISREQERPQQELQSSQHSTKYSVHHITTRPFWAVPTYLPTSAGESFLPLDLVMYDLSRRPAGEIEYSFGPVSPERSIALNLYFESLLGRDQSEDMELDRPPWVAVTDNYADFVRSGDVTVDIGRLSAVHRSSHDGLGMLEVELRYGEKITVKDVAAVVFATGFSPFGSLSFLPKDVLSLLEYSEDDSFFPLVLDGKGTSHAEVPNLGFVGMYRGPYWGVMEMQARSLAQSWDSEVAAGKDSAEERRQIRDLRGEHTRPQFPMGDYVGLMESFARELGIARYELPDQSPRSGPVVPARYYTPPVSELREQSQMEVTTTLKSLQAVISGHQQLSTAKAIFRALQGKWQYSRTVSTTDGDDTSSVSSGIASFHPRYPSEPGYEGEYLYEAKAEKQHDPSQSNQIRAVYRFREYNTVDKDEPVHISVWTADDLKSAGRHSHGLRFDSVSEKGKGTLDDKDKDNNDGNQLHHARGIGSGSSPLSTAENDTTTTPLSENAHQADYEYVYLFKTKGIAITSWEVTVYYSSPVEQDPGITTNAADSVPENDDPDPHIISPDGRSYRWCSKTVYQRW